MTNPKLKVEKRKIFGRKVKKLRQEGILPANIYGKKVKSLAVQVPLKEFEKVFKKTGETGIVELALDKEKTSRKVLIHNVQLHPVTDQFLHADFHQVVLTEKVKAAVPVVTKGESEAVEEKKGALLKLIDEIEVEALPTDLPEKIEVDISKLTDIDQEIKVADLKVSDKVVILTPASLVVVKIGPLVTKEAEELVKEEEEKAKEAKAEAAEKKEEEVAEKAPPEEVKKPAPSEEKNPKTVNTP